MLGALRLALAAIVVVSHVGVTISGLWISVSAVAIFFMISGYAVTGLIQTRFPHPRSAPTFYLERVVRLAPQYYFWLAASLIVVFVLKWKTIDTEGFIPFGLTAYLTVIPLGLQGFLGPVKTLVMPQATTLGIEMTFYAASPWLLQSRALTRIAGVIGIGIFAASAAGALPENQFTYYTSPGPIIFFVLGSFVYKRDWSSLTLFAGALAAILISHYGHGFNPELLMGLCVGLPAMIALARFPQNALDSALGNASYGCFLSHGLFMWTFQHHLAVTTFTPTLRAFIVTTSILAGFAAYYLVERPTVAYRRQLRERAEARAVPINGGQQAVSA